MALRQTVSFEDYLSWPEEKPYREFIHGEVREKSMPNNAHAAVQVALARWLDEWADEAGGEVLTELRCLLLRNAVLPDVAWFKSGSMKKDPKGRVISAPELAVEILSPDDRYGEVQDKISLYQEAGVQVVWVIDPEARNVTVHRSGQPSTLLRHEDTLTALELPGFSAKVADLFKKLD
ncbi:MAG: Uma2 family endonuclease [Candidatus Xenobia bacterium]